MPERGPSLVPGSRTESPPAIQSRGQVWPLPPADSRPRKCCRRDGNLEKLAETRLKQLPDSRQRRTPLLIEPSKGLRSHLSGRITPAKILSTQLHQMPRRAS